MPEGSKDIPVGTTVAVLVEDAGDVAAFANYSPAAGGAAAAAPKKAAAPKEAAPAAAAAGAPGSFPAHQVGKRWRGGAGLASMRAAGMRCCCRAEEEPAACTS